MFTQPGFANFVTTTSGRGVSKVSKTDTQDLYAIAQGNIAMTSRQNNIGHLYTYSPYGMQSDALHPINPNQTPDFQTRTHRQVLNIQHNRRGYTGQTKDQSTGYMMFGGFRLYDPNLGAYLGHDTLNIFSRHRVLNPWAYVKANPMFFVDSTGHEPVWENLFGDVQIRRFYDAEKGQDQLLKRVDLNLNGKTYYNVTRTDMAGKKHLYGRPEGMPQIKINLREFREFNEHEKATIEDAALLLNLSGERPKISIPGEIPRQPIVWITKRQEKEHRLHDTLKDLETALTNVRHLLGERVAQSKTMLPREALNSTVTPYLSRAQATMATVFSQVAESRTGMQVLSEDDIIDLQEVVEDDMSNMTQLSSLIQRWPAHLTDQDRTFLNAEPPHWRPVGASHTTRRIAIAPLGTPM